MFLTVLIASFLVMLVSLSGKLMTWRGAGPLIERNLHFFVSFAAGVLLLVAWNMSQEIVEHAGSLAAGLPWIALGAVVVLVAFRYLPHFHHHPEMKDHSHSQIDVNRILASDAIHNIGDGVVIVASFAASPMLGLASTVSIVVHEMLQEISEFFVLREAGLSVRTALLWNFAVSGTILIGTVGAYFLLEQFEMLEIPLLGLAVGSYLVVVFHDLIPHSIASLSERSHFIKHAIFFLAGLLLMAALVVFLPHVEPKHEEGIASGISRLV
jgi:zinc and cadmium transporter